MACSGTLECLQATMPMLSQVMAWSGILCKTVPFVIEVLYNRPGQLNLETRLKQLSGRLPKPLSLALCDSVLPMRPPTVTIRLLI